MMNERGWRRCSGANHPGSRRAEPLWKTCCGRCSPAKSSSSTTDMRTGLTLLAVITAVSAEPRPQIFSLAYSPDGKLIAAGGYKEVRLLDAATQRVKATLRG